MSISEDITKKVNKEVAKRRNIKSRDTGSAMLVTQSEINTHAINGMLCVFDSMDEEFDSFKEKLKILEEGQIKITKQVVELIGKIDYKQEIEVKK